jgi:prepilin-type N-terminal cleavage/methylation domain-containing protein
MRQRTVGFTLIELMVTLAVLAILAALAIPSFVDLRQRAALRGATDQLASFWGDARFEALRLNSMVKVGFRTTVGGDICIGAATTTNANDDTACDCFTAAACDVAAYPAAGAAGQADWRGVRIPSLPTMGDIDTDDDGVAVIDPKRGGLTDRNDAGRMSLRAPTGPMDYRLDVFIDGNGRAIQCEPAAAPSKTPEYGNRQC